MQAALQICPRWVRKHTSERCVSWLQPADGFRQGLLRPQSIRHHIVHCHEVEEHIQSSGRVTPQKFQSHYLIQEKEEEIFEVLWLICSIIRSLIDDKPGCSSLTSLTHSALLPTTLPCHPSLLVPKHGFKVWKTDLSPNNAPVLDVQPQETPSSTLKPRFCFLYHADNVERIEQ